MFVIAPELRDAADDDGADAQDAADLGGRARVHTIAVGKILFFQNLVHRVAVNHSILGVLCELLLEQK
jgi:hypothetical protein